MVGILRTLGLGWGCMLALGIATVDGAMTLTWTGCGGDSNWSTAANWNGSGVPEATDDVVGTAGELAMSNQ